MCEWIGELQWMHLSVIVSPKVWVVQVESLSGVHV